MNNITLTHELCAEDRARIDRLAAALEALQPQVITFTPPTSCGEPEPELDPIQQKLAETLAKVSTPTEEPTEATETAKVETAETVSPIEEAPTQEEDATPPITLEQIQQKVLQLAAANNGALKAQVRGIVNTYAKKVSDIPEDKWAEVWSKLTALETEGQA